MTSENQRVWTNIIKLRNFLRKPVISTPLNSIAFNGRQKIRQAMTQWEGKNACQS